MNSWIDLLTTIDGWHEHLGVEDHRRLACVSRRLAESQKWPVTIRRINQIDDLITLVLPPWDDPKLRREARIIWTVIWPLPADFTPQELVIDVEDDEDPVLVESGESVKRLEDLEIDRGALINGFDFTHLTELKIHLLEGVDQVALPVSLERLLLGSGECRVTNFDQLTRLEEVCLWQYEGDVRLNAPNLQQAVLHWRQIDPEFSHRHPNLEALEITNGSVDLNRLPTGLSWLMSHSQNRWSNNYRRFTQLQNLKLPNTIVNKGAFPESLRRLTCCRFNQRSFGPPLPQLTKLTATGSIWNSDLALGTPDVLEHVKVGGLKDGGWWYKLVDRGTWRGLFLSEIMVSFGLIGNKVRPKVAVSIVPLLAIFTAVNFTIFDLLCGWLIGRRYKRLRITTEAGYSRLVPTLRRAVEPAWDTDDEDDDD